MKVMAIDYGDARTGVAISDALGWMTGQTTVIHSWKPEKTAEEVARLLRESGAERLVMGFPRNMDGSIGFQAQKVQALAEQLANVGLNIAFQDERLTTVTAERALIEGGMHRQERKGTVDKVAAAVILQQYLDTLRNQT